MKIKSNKYLLARIRNHEVGIKYPDLIPAIACNIVIQRGDSIFNPTSYRHFSNWFYLVKAKEGYYYWYNINRDLIND